MTELPARDLPSVEARHEMQERLATVSFTDAIVAEAFTEAAARLLSAMEQANARPHATIVRPLCEREELDAEVTATVLRCIDVMQVAIDVADNLADDGEDPSVDGASGYSPELLATIFCLPSLLIARTVHAVCLIEGGSYAATRVLGTLEVMAGGQAKRDSEKVRATSGEQGLLLCLPLWLKGEAHQSDTEQAIETWAFALAESWERLLQAIDEDAPLVRARYHNAVQRLMEVWPLESAFERNGPLGVYALGFGRPIEPRATA